MQAESPQEITALLLDWQNGDEQALERLMPIVYDELRSLARSYLRRERPDHTLQPTALVNEAYMRLVDQARVSWQNRSHFYGIAARMMRRVLVDHARGQKAAKRGGGVVPLALDEALGVSDERDLDLVTLDDALKDLAELDERQAQVVELRFFGGVEVKDVAEILDVSTATVKREWSMAKAWLFRRVSNED